MTRKRPEMPKTAQQICLEQLPAAEAVLKNALAGIDILPSELEAAIFIIETVLDHPVSH